MKGIINGLYNPIYNTNISITWLLPKEGLNVYFLNIRKAPLYHLRLVLFRPKMD